MKAIFSALIISAILLALSTTMSKANLPIVVGGQELPTLAPMVERVQESLVSIAAQTQARSGRDPFDDPFFRRFFDQRRSSKQNLGVFSTGVVIDGLEGLILTNEHSVRGASEVKVTLNDGREVQGQVLGSDVASDVALIRVAESGLTAIDVANSSMLKVGDFVISIGDPLGEDNTLITGIVSAVAKANSLYAHQHFIRSDAAVGAGVLVNLKGELIGLNIAKSAQTAGNSRIGFSTPINVAMKIQQQLVKFGSPQRGFLAVQVQDLSQGLADAFDIQQVNGQQGGVVITSVGEDSSAMRSGLQVGDVVLKAGAQPISRSNDLRSIIGQQFAGDALELTVVRAGETVQLTPVLESSSRVSKMGTMVHHQLEGATFKNTDTQQVSTNVDDGVLVSQVEPGSVAWKHGVRENDLIVSANRRAVRDLGSFKEAIRGKEVLMLNIVRGNGSLFLLLQ
jgi:serine protease Do/serine protease DegQ